MKKSCKHRDTFYSGKRLSEVVSEHVRSHRKKKMIVIDPLRWQEDQHRRALLRRIYFRKRESERRTFF